jgi:rhomboid protease GluP
MLDSSPRSPDRLSRTEAPAFSSPEMAAFVERVTRRKAPAVITIIVLNVAVLIAMEATGGASNLDNLIRFGAKVNGLITQGQYWRLLTSVFIHVGFMHLFFNALALWMFGVTLEKVYGTGKFLLIYLLSGVGGSAASFLLSTQISVGASGAIFGLIGLALVFGIRHRAIIPPRFRSRFGTGVLPLILYNILYGLRPDSHIDNFAHLGGLVAGVILGLVIPADVESSNEPPVA